MNEEFNRKVIVYGEDFWIFYSSQTKKVQGKIDWIIGLVKTLKIIPEKFSNILREKKGFLKFV